MFNARIVDIFSWWFEFQFQDARDDDDDDDGSSYHPFLFSI